MIYGRINLNGALNSSDKKINDTLKFFYWNNCTSSQLNWNGFSGFFLIDPKLTYSKEDSYFIDENNEILILVDGFIYNKDEIIDKLSLYDHSLDTPRTVLSAFLKWGASFVKEFNGDFAICIYEKKSSKAYFYRDHLGIRPLAICQIGHEIYFSTDIMGLCKALFNNTRIDPGYLLNLFLETGWSYASLPDKQVKKVLPGHYIFANIDSQIQFKYWDPSVIRKDKKLNFHSVKSDLKVLLKDSIRIRSDKRFFASAHVSGGLDSGVVAALARDEYKDQQKFFGFSWTPSRLTGYGEIKGDERSLVKGICLQNNIISVHSNFTVEDYFASMSDWRHPSELVFEKKIIEAARERGVNLIFSGWGGDEFISTKDRGIDADLIKEFNWGCFLKKHHLRQPKKLLSALCFNVIFPSARRSYLKYKTDPYTYRFIKSKLGSNLLTRNQKISYNSRRRIHLQLIEMNHLAARCEDWYVHGQRNGIEYRYPLLDKRIVEYMLKVPSRCLVEGSNNRIVLRNIGKEILPDTVISNKSKDDPVKSYFLEKVANEATKILINEVIEFRNNRDLDFVDFDLLERRIKEYSEGRNSDDLANILFYINRAHEFTKGFYKQ